MGDLKSSYKNFGSVTEKGKVFMTVKYAGATPVPVAVLGPGNVIGTDFFNTIDEPRKYSFLLCLDDEFADASLLLLSHAGTGPAVQNSPRLDHVAFEEQLAATAFWSARSLLRSPELDLHWPGARR
jgi:hypothetical protein